MESGGEPEMGGSEEGGQFLEILPQTSGRVIEGGHDQARPHQIQGEEEETRQTAGDGNDHEGSQGVGTV